MPKPELEPLTSEEYVKTSGAYCPYCQSTDLQPSPLGVEFTIDCIFQEVTCLQCERQWTDQYKLVGYSPCS